MIQIPKKKNLYNKSHNIKRDFYSDVYTILREKGRDLTQPNNKKPPHQQKRQMGKMTTQTTPQKFDYRAETCGPTKDGQLE